MVKVLESISSNIGKFYAHMSSEDHVSGIKLVPVETKGEFSGIVFNLTFFEKNAESPKTYLSESRLNCLGLSIFLASISLFNKNIEFIIFDDVISSFDKNHRYRFDQLLREQFGNYQLIVLTHEKEWFNSFAPKVRGLGWAINRTYWDSNKGIQAEIPLVGYEERIESMIESSKIHGLGNQIRKYAENKLKKICNSLYIPIPFKYNDGNERRTLEELRIWLIKGLKGTDIYTQNKSLFQRISDLGVLSNDSSHDGGYEENMSDMKAAYEDIKNFKNIFICSQCDHFLIVNTDSHFKPKSCKCN